MFRPRVRRRVGPPEALGWLVLLLLLAGCAVVATASSGIGPPGFGLAVSYGPFFAGKHAWALLTNDGQTSSQLTTLDVQWGTGSQPLQEVRWGGTTIWTGTQYDNIRLVGLRGDLPPGAMRELMFVFAGPITRLSFQATFDGHRFVFHNDLRQPITPPPFPVTPAPTVPSSTTGPSPTLRPTPTPRPTRTPLPSATPWPTVTHRPTSTPGPTTPSPTPFPLSPPITVTLASPGWTLFRNTNEARELAFDRENGLWAIGADSVVRWDLARHTYTRYTTADGLGSDDVRAVAMAPDGTLWFATAGGVSRFDGRRWTTYTETAGLASGDVRDVAFAPDGAVWFATAGGASRFDGRRWTTYTQAAGLANSDVRDVAFAPDGAAWFATAGGVSRFDGKLWNSYTAADGLESDRARQIIMTPAGTLWAATSAGLARFDGTGWRNLGFNRVAAIAATPDGTIWIGQWYSTSYRDEGTLVSIPAAAPDEVEQWVSRGIGVGSVRDMAVGPDGSLWVSTANWLTHELALTRWDGQGWTDYSVESGGYTAGVGAVTVAPDGTVCVGGGERGIYCFNPQGSGQSWQTYGTADGPAGSQFRALAVAPNGDVWVSEYPYTGIFRFDGRHWTTMGTDIEGQVLAVSSDGTLWSSSHNGVLHFADRLWIAYPLSYADFDTGTHPLAVAPNGNVWVGNFRQGVFRYDGEKWITYAPADSLTEGPIYAIAAAADGTIWVGSTNGVSRFDGPGWTSYSTGLLSQGVTSLAVAADGTVWAGTPSGLARFNGQAWVSSGLDIPYADAIAAAADGAIWFGTAEGSVFRFDGRTLTRYDFSTLGYYASEGPHAMAVAADGAVWFTFDDFILRYAPGAGP